MTERHANHYTEEQRAAALAQLELNGGNAYRTSRQLGIPRPTLQLWYRQREAIAAGREIALQELKDAGMLEQSPGMSSQKELFAERGGRVQQVLLDQLEKRAIKPQKLRDLAVAAGIAADKQMDYSLGRRGADVHVGIDQRSVTLVVESKTPRPLLSEGQEISHVSDGDAQCQADDVPDHL